MRIYNYPNRLDEYFGKANLTLEQSDIVLLRDVLRLVMDRTEMSSKDRLSVLTVILSKQYPNHTFDIKFIIDTGLQLGLFRSEKDIYLHSISVKEQRLSKST